MVLVRREIPKMWCNGRCPSVVAMIPDELAKIPVIEHTFDVLEGAGGGLVTTDWRKGVVLNLSNLIGAMAREVYENDMAKALLFSESDPEKSSKDCTPSFLRFSRFMGQPLFNELAERVGYNIRDNGICGTLYGVMARTPHYATRTREAGFRDYYLPGRTEWSPSKALVDGYRGDGLILLPIPERVVMDRLGIKAGKK